MQVVPAEWVRLSTASHVPVPGTEQGLGYGYQWWVMGGLPDPAFEARGRFGQRITVVPALDLVVVVTSPTESHGAPARLLQEHILPAVRWSEPLPPDPEGAAALQSILEQIARP